MWSVKSIRNLILQQRYIAESSSLTYSLLCVFDVMDTFMTGESPVPSTVVQVEEAPLNRANKAPYRLDLPGIKQKLRSFFPVGKHE